MSLTKIQEEFLNKEYDFVEKAYEMQFTHFMRVFEFWLIVVTFPTTAGIITQIFQSNNISTNIDLIGILFLIIGVIGFFISSKMFDIRGSQFRYIGYMRKIRLALFKVNEISENVLYDICFQKIGKKGKPEEHKKQHLYPLDSDLHGKVKKLWVTASQDFGAIMAIIMSIIDSLLVSYGVLILKTRSTTISLTTWWITLLFILLNLLPYAYFVIYKTCKIESYK